MDLIDVVRIAARRWYVVGVILMAGLVAALLLASSVAPEYTVETQSILISGQVPSSQPGVDEPGNPYLSFSGSLFTTLSAVTRTVDGQEYRERLDADGTDRDFEFQTSQEAPVIITESTASTPAEALELGSQVQDALSETLVTLQSEENVPQEQQIFMRVLTTSKPVQEVGNRNRVLFGVLGLSFAASIGGAVLVESILQARKRSGQELDRDDQELDRDDGAGEDQTGANDPHGSTNTAGEGGSRTSRGEEGRPDEPDDRSRRTASAFPTGRGGVPASTSGRSTPDSGT